MDYCKHLSEQLAVVATIDPAPVPASTVTSDAVDMSKFRKAMFILTTGALGASATVDFKLRQGIGSGMTTPLDLAGKTVVQLVKATDDNKQVIIEVRAEELSVNLGYTHVHASVTVGTATSQLSLVALGGVARNEPVAADDLATVAQIVTA